MLLDGKIRQEIADEAVHDEVGIWMICSYINNEFGNLESSALKEGLLVNLNVLLDNANICMATYNIVLGQYVVWTGDKASSLSRVAAEWDGLGRIPTLGDIGVLMKNKLLR